MAETFTASDGATFKLVPKAPQTFTASDGAQFKLVPKAPAAEPFITGRGAAAFALRTLPPILATPFGPVASAAMGAAGELGGQGLEILSGEREGLNLKTAAVAGAASAFPLAKLKAGAGLATRLFARAGQGAAEGALVTGAVDLTEGREFSPGRVAFGAGLGAAGGGIVGGFEARAARKLLPSGPKAGAAKSASPEPSPVPPADALPPSAAPVTPIQVATPPSVIVAAREVPSNEFMVRRTDDVLPGASLASSARQAAWRGSQERVEGIFGDLPAENKSLLTDIFARNTEAIDEAARGRVPDDLRETVAASLAPRLGVKLGRGEVLGDAAQASTLNATALLTDDLVKLNAQRTGLISGGSDAAELSAKIEQKYADLTNLVTAVTGSASEAARTLRTQQMLASPAMKAGGKLSRDLRRAGASKVTADQITAMMLVLEKSGAGEGAAATRRAFAKAVLTATPRTWAQGFSDNLKGALLFRVGSNVRNTVGSVYNIAYETASIPFAASADIGRVRQFGGEREVFAGEATRVLPGILLGVREGSQLFTNAFRHADFDNPTTLIEKIRAEGLRGARSELAPARGLPILRWGSDLLQGTDEFFQAISRNVQRQRMAFASAKKAGLSGKDATDHIADLTENPTDAMLAAEKALGRRITYQEDPDSITAGIMAWKAKRAAGGAIEQGASMVMDATMPFVRTPSNILRRGMLNTPGLGFAVQKYEVNRLVKAAAGRDSELEAQLRNRIAAGVKGEAVLGTAMLTPIAALYASGRLTGSPPEDKVERDIFYRSGKIPNAVRIGDKWVKLATFAPSLALPASIVANAASAASKLGSDPGALAILGLSDVMLTKSIESMFDASYFEGIERVMQSFQYSETLGGAIGDTIAQTAGSFVPGVVSEVAAARDPVVRDPRGPIEAVKRNIPGLSESVPARLSGRGEPIVKRPFIPGFGDIAEAQPQDALDLALSSLRAQGYQVGTVPPRDKRTVSLPDPTAGGMRDIALPPDEAAAANAAMTRVATKFMQHVVASREFAKAPPAAQAHILNAAKSKAQMIVGRMTQATRALGEPITDATFSRLLD